MTFLKWIHTFRNAALYPLVLNALVSGAHHQQPFTEKDSILVKDSIIRLTDAIARDVSVKGAIAWLDYFDDDPGFFMANDGKLTLRDNPGAKRFIQDTLIKIIPAISLRWANLRIDPLSKHISASRKWSTKC